MSEHKHWGTTTDISGNMVEADSSMAPPQNQVIVHEALYIVGLSHLRFYFYQIMHFCHKSNSKTNKQTKKSTELNQAKHFLSHIPNCYFIENHLTLPPLSPPAPNWRKHSFWLTYKSRYLLTVLYYQLNDIYSWNIYSCYETYSLRRILWYIQNKGPALKCSYSIEAHEAFAVSLSTPNHYDYSWISTKFEKLCFGFLA